MLPSDHFIADEARFAGACWQRAVAVAERGELATVGIVPTRPETGYGYIEVGAELEGGAKQVARFVEKPDRARAEAFLASGKHLWNAGMFFFRARDMQAAIVGKHLPELAAGVARIDEAARSGNEREVVRESSPRSAIDHGVMERVGATAGNIAVVPGEFGWNDVGSWESTWELSDKDEKGNAAPRHADRGRRERQPLRARAAKGKKAVALVGVSDLVVVDTEDAILVMPRDRAQDVRAVVDALKAQGRSELL